MNTSCSSSSIFGTNVSEGVKNWSIAMKHNWLLDYGQIISVEYISESSSVIELPRIQHEVTQVLHLVSCEKVVSPTLKWVGSSIY
jgi:hypothetical protein